ITPQVQDHSKATLAPILQREDGRMDFAAHTARELVNRWRGFQPWPGAFTMLGGKKLIAHGVQAAEYARGGAEPGTVVVDGGKLLVACAQGTWIELMELQLEGKKRLTAAEFLRGTKLDAGTRLG
ncbi:MAG TPA: methionyl-tRNA formyltransferase, partial [Terracidiphilus sp.]